MLNKCDQATDKVASPALNTSSETNTVITSNQSHFLVLWEDLWIGLSLYSFNFPADIVIFPSNQSLCFVYFHFTNFSNFEVSRCFGFCELNNLTVLWTSPRISVKWWLTKSASALLIRGVPCLDLTCIANNTFVLIEVDTVKSKWKKNTPLSYYVVWVILQQWITCQSSLKPGLNSVYNFAPSLHILSTRFTR